MKDCCKVGDEKPPIKIKIWAKRLLWGIIILAVIGVFFIQIFNL